MLSGATGTLPKLDFQCWILVCVPHHQNHLQDYLYDGFCKQAEHIKDRCCLKCKQQWNEEQRTMIYPEECPRLASVCHEKLGGKDSEQKALKSGEKSSVQVCTGMNPQPHVVGGLVRVLMPPTGVDTDTESMNEWLPLTCFHPSSRALQ